MSTIQVRRHPDGKPYLAVTGLTDSELDTLVGLRESMARHPAAVTPAKARYRPTGDNDQ